MRRKLLRAIGVSCARTAPNGSTFAVMEQSTLAGESEMVSYPELARELGLTPGERRVIMDEGLLETVRRQQGAPTWITPDAERLLRDAKRIIDDIRQDPVKSIAVGVTIVVVLRLLASGAVKPNLP